MNDGYFREILGITENATREQIRQAYRRLVMENHPDRFPIEKKPLQELATIALMEAYAVLMKAPIAREATAVKPAPVKPAAVRRERRAEPNASAAAVAPHRDPAYAYYKQGFINFSLAIHGVAEINRRIAAGRVPRLTRRYTASEDIASSLAFLRSAHGYFSRVAEDHPGSVWSADSRAKLRRIERFTSIYRRILANLGAR